MHLYLCTRIGSVGWDETRAAIVAADSEEQAEEIFRKLQMPQKAEVSISNIGQAKRSMEEGVVLEDFKAG
jgi:hypothetical protein